MAKASVLVVEGNPMSRATAVDMFIDLGFTVFEAYNGYHALALLEGHPEISLFFVDVRMPGMSGPELAELVRHRRPDIKIILTSGYVSEEFLPSDVHFLPKPWRVDQVANAVGGYQA
jgi:two-component system, response regulator PdtaR